MSDRLTAVTRRRLDIQGFERVPDATLTPVAPWLRLAFGLCTLTIGAGTLMASQTILLILLPIAFLGALLPIHPLDLLYNYGVRFVTGTAELPRRGAPARFACGISTVSLIIMIWAFNSGVDAVGYLLGGTMTAVGTLVSTTDICIPSLVYRSLFGFPEKRTGEHAPADEGAASNVE